MESTVEKYHVTVFKPFDFKVGQKIRIDGGKRGGDWEVIGVTEAKVKLRCPVSGREFEWPQFCYQVDERDNETWPLE
jgi:hypothetical protein